MIARGAEARVRRVCCVAVGQDAHRGQWRASGNGCPPSHRCIDALKGLNVSGSYESITNKNMHRQKEIVECFRIWQVAYDQVNGSLAGSSLNSIMERLAPVQCPLLFYDQVGISCRTTRPP